MESTSQFLDVLALKTCLPGRVLSAALLTRQLNTLVNWYLFSSEIFIFLYYIIIYIIVGLVLVSFTMAYYFIWIFTYILHSNNVSNVALNSKQFFNDIILWWFFKFYYYYFNTVKKISWFKNIFFFKIVISFSYKKYYTNE